MAFLEGNDSGGTSLKKTSSGTAYRPVSKPAPKPKKASVSKPTARRSTSGYSSGGSRPVSSYSGRSGGNYSGSAVGSNASGTIAKPAKPQMSQGQFLAQDATFKSQQAAYQKALADYAAQYGAEQQKYNTEYDAGVDKLGLERTQGAEALKDDYAGRGLLQSGVYADALNEFNTGYDTRLADMGRAKSNYLSDLLTGKTNFETEQKLMQDKARQDAINRYMASIGV